MEKHQQRVIVQIYKFIVSNVAGNLVASGQGTSSLNYLDATSSIQSQLNGKAASNGYNNNRFLRTDGSGAMDESSIEISESHLTAISTLTGNAQDQLDTLEGLLDTKQLLNKIRM